MVVRALDPVPLEILLDLLVVSLLAAAVAVVRSSTEMAFLRSALAPEVVDSFLFAWFAWAAALVAFVWFAECL